MLITLSRIVGSFFLMFIEPLSLLFFAVYALCGASDIIDGFLARKFNVASKQGAVFDSVADFVFVLVMLVLFIPILPWKQWVLYWVALIAIIRLTAFGVGLIKYRAVALLHTYANKITGIMLFLFPFLYRSLNFTIALFIICSIACLSAVEELFIALRSKRLDRNIRSIFFK